jgi:hypothetical protein
MSVMNSRISLPPPRLRTRHRSGSNAPFGAPVTPVLPQAIFEGAEFELSIGAGEGIRTLDPDLGKVVLYP